MKTEATQLVTAIGIEIGVRVQVNRDQHLVRGGPPHYPGRKGVVVGRNPCGKDDHKGLWYVDLEATNRAKARQASFWGAELSIIQHLETL